MTERKLDPIDRIIGVNMRRLRLARDMSQTQVGELLPVTFEQIRKYEKGINAISAANLARLAVGLKCTMEEFLT